MTSPAVAPVSHSPTPGPRPSSQGSPPPSRVPSARAADMAALPRARPVRRSASGPAWAWTVSTYQASAGPLDRARAQPIRAMPSAMAQAAPARPKRVKAVQLRSPAAARTVRRPMTSDRPPVGSSIAAAVRECTAKNPAMAARPMPRSVKRSTPVAMDMPMGSQKRNETATNRRRAVRGSRPRAVGAGGCGIADPAAGSGVPVLPLTGRSPRRRRTGRRGRTRHRIGRRVQGPVVARP